MSKVPKRKIIGSECINVSNWRSKTDRTSDLSIISEYNWYDDGTEGPSTRLVENYKRPFWVVKEAHRTYKDKHISEDLSKCDVHYANQARLPIEAQRRLGQIPDPKKSLSQVARSPYLYGADVSTPTVIKKRYKVKFPELVGKGDRRMAALDIESNVLGGREHIISIAVTFKEDHYLLVLNDFVRKIDNPEQKLHEAYNKYLSDFEGVDKKGNPIRRNIIKERNSKLHIRFKDKPHELVIGAYDILHRLNLDFLNIYNIQFDITRMMEELQKAGVPLEDVFCDPAVPEEYRTFNFKEDGVRKETSTGKSMSKHYAELWHVVQAPSRFYTICSMATYKKSRLGKADLLNYKLDTVLDTELGVRKLKFKEADHLEKLEWHKFMQEKYPIEYLIYNVFDCIALELLDEKTKDITQGLLFSVDCTEFARWGSGPKKLSDDMHFFALSKGLVLGTTSDQMRVDYDAMVPTMNHWIAMLQSANMSEKGVAVFKDAPHLHSSVYLSASDQDVSAAYPTGEDLWNVGRETSRIELCAIEGVDERLQRKAGIDMCTSRVNALDITHNIFNFPTLKESVNVFEEWNEVKKAA